MFLHLAVIQFQPLTLSDALWKSNLIQNDWFLQVCSVNGSDMPTSFLPHILCTIQTIHKVWPTLLWGLRIVKGHIKIFSITYNGEYCKTIILQQKPHKLHCYCTLLFCYESITILHSYFIRINHIIYILLLFLFAMDGFDMFKWFYFLSSKSIQRGDNYNMRRGNVIAI